MAQLSERIAALETKLKALKSRQVKHDSRKRTIESRRSRKADTRRKILIGAIVLARVEQGRLTRTEVTAWLDQALTRAEDRELFALPESGRMDQLALQSVVKDNNPTPGGAFRRSPA